ncbi:MAG: redox-sensing transcriptional repressor Rex [Sulfobacillus thermosulfidooxidans]|uniref:redox-sensing transcriptional repressor Rex n=1 Tax=Sulfobacillus sp. hq2 TaxID=2039167 RepID=UPI000CCFE32F|nr:redox-sensing transcriptional repressor Rex [Sulfobacillus sp. hq2]POB11993.1 redox-sensing transcriptional repressor Rex [Sulfobacillus sp. hq2]PSR35760.1 MAG: redox-sensing transcriptional repressor Rex [Sulfobacillus thermosulfidooxidans]
MQRIPDAAIRRLPAYLRWLTECQQERVTSVMLGQATGYSSEQVRKDLAYFGAFGTRGVGYDVAALREEIYHILRLDRGVRAMVVGAGHLGTALVRYVDQGHQDVQIMALLDSNPAIIGSQVGSLRVESVDRLEELVHEFGIGIAVLTVPKEAAVTVADRLAQSGVRAILNFAPVAVCTHYPDVFVQPIDLTLELQALSYFVGQREQHTL